MCIAVGRLTKTAQVQRASLTEHKMLGIKDAAQESMDPHLYVLSYDGL